MAVENDDHRIISGLRHTPTTMELLGIFGCNFWILTSVCVRRICYCLDRGWRCPTSLGSWTDYPEVSSIIGEICIVFRCILVTCIQMPIFYQLRSGKTVRCCWQESKRMHNNLYSGISASWLGVRTGLIQNNIKRRVSWGCIKSGTTKVQKLYQICPVSLYQPGHTLGYLPLMRCDPVHGEPHRLGLSVPASCGIVMIKGCHDLQKIGWRWGCQGLPMPISFANRHVPSTENRCRIESLNHLRGSRWSSICENREKEMDPHGSTTMVTIPLKRCNLPFQVMLQQTLWWYIATLPSGTQINVRLGHIWPVECLEINKNCLCFSTKRHIQQT